MLEHFSIATYPQRDQYPTTAIYGGSFDMPHNGHVMLAGFLGLMFDRVIVPVAFQNPTKATSTASYQDRLAMTRLAMRGVKGVHVSDIESRIRDTRTYGVLSALQEEDPGRYTFVLGADCLAEIVKWGNVEGIMAHANLLGFNRDPLDAVEVAKTLPNFIRARTFFAPNMIIKQVSSSEIREKQDFREVPEPVVEYIREKRLYGF